MARPITWQEVAAPRGQAVAIEAFGRGGDRLAQAVANIGQVAVDYRDDRIKTATDAAIASIANSDNPDAAVAAVPKGWEFDPLAIAKASNARQNQILDTGIKQNTLEDQQSRQADRESARLVSQAVIPLIDLARAGKPLPIDATKDPIWSTPSGLEALKYLDGIRNTEEDNRNDAARLRLEGIRARAAQAQLDRTLKLENYYGWAREQAALPETQAMRPELRDKLLVEGAKRFGLPAMYADNATGYWDKGTAANPATPEQLGQRAPGSDQTYQWGARVLADAQAYGESQRAAILAAPYDPTNPTKPDPNRPSLLQLKEVATRGPGFTEGPIGFVATELAAKSDMDVDEARGRILAIKGKYRYLTDAQAADLALQSADRWFDSTAAASPEVRDGALMYREVDRLGGLPGITRLEKEATASVDRDLGKIPGAVLRLTGAARGRLALPEDVLKFDSVLKAARARQAKEEAAAEEEKARAEEAAKVMAQQAAFSSGIGY